MARASAAASRQTAIALPEEIELIRFEKNLLQIGFFSAHDRRTTADDTMRRMEQWVNRKGKKIRVSAEFRSTLGLPSTSDRDKYMAFMQIAMDLKKKTGELVNPVRFNGYSMLKALGLTDAGNNYEDLNQWGMRMADTTITSEQIIYSASKKTFMNKTVHVFRSFTRAGQSNLDNTNQQVHFSVELEDWLLENLNQSYVVPEDFAQYRKLRRPIAKGIFPHLTHWFYASSGKEVSRDYVELCSFLNVRCYGPISKINYTMGQSLDELVSIQYLEAWRIESMTSKRGYKLVLTPGRAILDFLDQNSVKQKAQQALPSQASKALTSEQESAYSVMISQGISEEKSEALCRQLDSEVLLDRLDYILNELARGGGRRINNPAGLIISFVEGNKKIPPTFETRSARAARFSENEEKERISQAKNAAALEQLQWEQRYTAWVKEQVENEIAENMSEIELDRRFKEIQAERVKKDSHSATMLRRLSPKQLRNALEPMLYKEIAAELDLPLFDEWLENTSKQGDLFLIQ